MRATKFGTNAALPQVFYRCDNADDWKAGGDSKIWLGDDNAFGVNSKGHNFARFTVSDHTDVHLGI